MPDDAEKARGPKGGVKHQPGSGHDRKSGPEKKKRFARKATRKRDEAEKEAEAEWAEWDELTDDAKGLLGPTAQPKMPRPNDEQ